MVDAASVAWDGTGVFSSMNIRAAVRLAVRAADRPRGRKSKDAVTRDVLDQLLATCCGRHSRRHPRPRS